MQIKVIAIQTDRLRLGKFMAEFSVKENDILEIPEKYPLIEEDGYLYVCQTNIPKIISQPGKIHSKYLQLDLDISKDGTQLIYVYSNGFMNRPMYLCTLEIMSISPNV